MEDPQKASINQPKPNGENASEAGQDAPGPAAEQDARRRQMDELTRAYERARDELNEAVRSLRAEIAKIDLEQARVRARTWVDENPTLAVFLGIGAGILTGRLLANALRHEPPSLQTRARRRADLLSHQAEESAQELAAAIAHHLGKAARSAGDAGDVVAHRGAEFAGIVTRRAREVGDELSHRAERAGRDFSRHASHVGRDVSRRAEGAAESIADSTARSVQALEDAAHDLSKTLKKRSKKASKGARKKIDRGVSFSETALNAARTAVAAVAVKKVNDWVQKMR